ncbi:MAG: OmpA family protein [Bacteroidia bacterium]|nr:OmpA family protein [Bacteroidia bacterium]
MEKVILVLWLQILFGLQIAQAQVSYWQKYLGGEALDQGQRLKVLEDGTLLMGGTTYSTKYLVDKNHGDSDILVLKLSTQGTIFWKSILGGTKEEHLNDLIQTSDKGYLLMGRSASDDGDVEKNRGYNDIWIVKLDPDGQIQWTQSFGGYNDEQAMAGIELSNGDFLVAGEASSHNMSYHRPHHEGLDGWIARLSPDGTVLWEKQYGGNGNEQIRALYQLSEEKFLAIGSTDSYDGDLSDNRGKKDVWFFYIDGEGEIIESYTFGGKENDIANSVQMDNRGNFILVGTTFSTDGDISFQRGDGDAWIFKVSPRGQLLWSKTYGGRLSEGFMDIQPTQDRGYILCGLTKSRTGEGDIEYNSGYYEGWVFKCDVDGNKIWSRTIGYQGKDVLNSIVEVPRGGYLCFGYATQGRDGYILPEHKGGADFWLCNMSDPERQGVKPYVTPPVLVGNILDRSNNDPVQATITLTENKSLDSLGSAQSKGEDGGFAMIMPTYGLVSINVLGEGYMFYGRNYLMDTVIDRTTIQQEILLDPIRVGAKLILKNTYFKTGKWDLLENSFAELQRVKKFLQLNPRVKVQISGHTDNTGNRSSKEELSLNRANSVKDYLIRQGIPAYQMRVKGFGMYKPIASNKTAAGRAKNRRVEIEVIQK